MKLPRIICAIMLALPLALFAQTAKTKAALYTDIDANLASGTQITAAQLRTMFKNTVASADNTLTDGAPLYTAGTTSFGRALLTETSAGTLKTTMALVIGTNVQAWDADLDYLAGFTPTANVKSFLNAADYAAMKTLLGLTIGTNVQAFVAPSTSGNVLTSDGTNWTSAAPPTGTLPSQTGHAGEFLTTNGSAVSWGAGSGSGTVTSFSAGDLSPLFTTTEATVTTTPALTFVLTNASANTVLAGPTSGGAGAPSYRSLVAADIPSLSATYQPLDSDLTAIAALSTTSYGRSLLTSADAAAARAAQSSASTTQTITLGYGVDGGGSVITTGARFARVVKQACTITSWDIVADQAGSITLDLRKGTPSGGAVTTSTITASATPALSGTRVTSSSTLTGWTTSLAAGDVLEVVVTGSPATLTRVALNVNVTVTLN